MDLKIALLVGLVVGLIAAAIWLWPSPVPILVPTAEIAVEDATWQWTIELQGSSDLILEATAVRPRIRTGQAATSRLVSPLSPSTELGEATENVAPRIVVEHAATASSVPIGVTAAPSVIASPRILVEHAATVIVIRALGSSSGLQSDSARVSTKLLIENAEVVDIKLLEAMPPDSLGQ